MLADSHVELRCLDDDFVVAVAKCTGKLLTGMKIIKWLIVLSTKLLLMFTLSGGK